MSEEQNSIIRLMKPTEKKAVKKLLRRSFPITEWWPFSFSKHVLVAEFNNEIVGTVVLKFYSIYKKRKACVLEYIFTAPEVRGMGFGQKLVEASIKYSKEQGCDEFITQIKGDNTSSSKLFSTRGFSVLSPGQQCRRYGIGIIGLWLKTKRFFAKGQLFWVQTEIEKPDKPVIQWWGNLLANILLFFFFTMRPEIAIEFNLQTFVPISLIFISFFGIRYLSMMGIGKALRLDLRYHPIEDWFTMSFILGFGAGLWIPIPGNVYPKEMTWNYRENIKKLGPTAFLGALVVLLFTWITFMMFNLMALSSEVEFWMNHAIKFGAELALLDIVFPFFPLEFFNGRRIWDWNRYIWAVLTATAVTTFIIAFYFI